MACGLPALAEAQAVAGAAGGGLRPDTRARRAAPPHRAGGLDGGGQVDLAQRAGRHGAGARGRGPTDVVRGHRLRPGRRRPRRARRGGPPGGPVHGRGGERLVGAGVRRHAGPQLRRPHERGGGAGRAGPGRCGAAGLPSGLGGGGPTHRGASSLRPAPGPARGGELRRPARQRGAADAPRAGGAGASGRARPRRAAAGLRGQRAAARLGEPLDDDWQGLLQSLQTLAEAGVATELRRRNAEALLGQIRARVADALRTTEEAQGEVRKALDAGLDTVRAPLGDDFRVRLGGAGGFLRQSVRRQAAGRLTGPIGWGLRLSGWGSGGLAGAALASQASLPAGLLVAATGAVLDEVQSRGRQAAAERVRDHGRRSARRARTTGAGTGAGRRRRARTPAGGHRASGSSEPGWRDSRRRGRSPGAR